MLELRRFNNLIGIRGQNGPLAFHSENMEVARISEEAWQAFSTPNPATESLQIWEQEKNPAIQREKLSQQVRSITLNVTQVCNLHCTYCAAGGDGTYGDPVRKISIDKTLPQVSYFLNKAPEGSDFQITFIGGEPLLYPAAIAGIAKHAQELAAIKNISTRFTVVTNGTLINEETLKVLAQINAHITVSLDGPPEINDKTRPNKAGKGVTHQVEKGLKLLKENKKNLGSLQISAVFGPQNLDVYSAYKYFSQFEADELDFMFDHLCFDKEVSRTFIKNMQDLLADIAKTEGERGIRRFKQISQWMEQLDTQTQVENFCGAGKSFLMVDSRNAVYTCPWLVGQTEEVVGHGSTIWSDKLEPYQAPLIEKNNCQSCWARFLCGGGCMYIHSQSSGSKNIKDPGFCERTRSLIATTLMYYEQFRQTEEEGEL